MDKPAHLMVHPSNPGNPPTLWDGLRLLLAYELANGGQISIITRLDRETSGVVLIAKHRGMARTMSKAMERGEFSKTYLAVVSGWPVEDEFVIDAPLVRKGEVESSPVWVRQIAHPSGKACFTEISVKRRFQRAIDGETRPFSLLECRPRTGRMHQIRAHLHHAGFPILGDKLYGPDERCYLEFIETGWSPALARRLLLDRQALHAHRLEWRDFVWVCPLSADLAAFCDE